MKFIQKKHIPSYIENVEHTLAPCVKCDGDDLKINEYDNQYGYITTITCKKCKSLIKVNCDTVCAIKKWNNENDISKLILKKENTILELKEEVKKLKIKFKLRQKNENVKI